ncbi:unnamed protein product [Anisakis simplex]|uniref:Uncharacterized protein n=1 Tax=Anisakis simplex TaxID=6269 RepID=A0A0M3JGB0_ANISI|nr:unnamed protein product [Anisakis simplex]
MPPVRRRRERVVDDGMWCGVEGGLEKLRSRK